MKGTVGTFIVALGIIALVIFTWILYSAFLAPIKEMIYVKVPQGVPSFVPLQHGCSLGAKELNLTKVIPSGDGVIVESELPVGSRFTFKASCGRIIKIVNVEVTADTYSYSTFKVEASSPR